MLYDMPAATNHRQAADGANEELERTASEGWDAAGGRIEDLALSPSSNSKMFWVFKIREHLKACNPAAGSHSLNSMKLFETLKITGKLWVVGLAGIRSGNSIPFRKPWGSTWFHDVRMRNYEPHIG